MNGWGHAAVLPPPGYRRPSGVDGSGLVVLAVGQAGESLGTFDFTGCPGPAEFRRELVAAYIIRGRLRWNSAATYENYAHLLRSFLIWAGQCRPQVESAADVTPARWKQWLLAGPAAASTLGVVLAEAPSLPDATRAIAQA